MTPLAYLVVHPPTSMRWLSQKYGHHCQSHSAYKTSELKRHVGLVSTSRSFPKTIIIVWKNNYKYFHIIFNILKGIMICYTDFKKPTRKIENAGHMGANSGGATGAIAHPRICQEG